MSVKVDAFWMAREILSKDIDLENEMIKIKFEEDLRRGNIVGDYIPKFRKSPSVKKTIKLAQDIEKYLSELAD